MSFSPSAQAALREAWESDEKKWTYPEIAVDAALLQEVADMIRTPENRRLITIGTTSISQLGTAGLVAGGGERALALARELAEEWQSDERSDFAWLMRSSGITWPLQV